MSDRPPYREHSSSAKFPKDDGTGLPGTVQTGTWLLEGQVLQLRSYGTHTGQVPQTGFITSLPAGWLEHTAWWSATMPWWTITGKRHNYRLGPHPHRSALNSLDPISSSSSTSEKFFWIIKLINHSTTGNSVQFVDRDVTASTGASLVCSTDSSPTHDREVTHDMEQTSTGLQTNRPVITHMEQVDDLVMQISGTGHWFLEGWIRDQLVEFLVDSGSSVKAMSNSFYQTLVGAGHTLDIKNGLLFT